MKHFLSFQTVFILNENIKWLEEFLIYYIHIGFDHFYLYHNEGSNGYHGTTFRNKYGFQISTTSSASDLADLQLILEKYGSYITYIKWQPVVNGSIVYGQNQAIDHFFQNYSLDNEWVAFLDLDEFIYGDIIGYLKSVRDIGCVQLQQKKFLDRFLTDQKFVTQEFRCMSHKRGSQRWPKNIVKVSDYISCPNIHTFRVRSKIDKPDISILRFNHYNFNKVQNKLMKEIYDSKDDFECDDIDEGMSKYKYLFQY